jgi:hypothetical protein
VRDLERLNRGELDRKTYLRRLDRNAASLVPVPVYSSQGGQPTGDREYQGLACPNGCDPQVPGPGSAVVMFHEQFPASEPDGGGVSGNDSYSGNRHQRNRRSL